MLVILLNKLKQPQELFVLGADSIFYLCTLESIVVVENRRNQGTVSQVYSGY